MLSLGRHGWAGGEVTRCSLNVEAAIPGIEGVPPWQAELPASHLKDKVSEGFCRPRVPGWLPGQGLCGGDWMAGSGMSLLFPIPKPTAVLTSAPKQMGLS